MIQFSQVWQDPSVELKAVNLFNKDNIDFFIIGSGGCTLLSLLNNINIKNLFVLDSNQEQIFLIQLKMMLYYNIENKNKYILFIEGKLNHDEVNKIFYNLNLDEKCKNYWITHIDLIYKGINKIGNFELLLKNLVNNNSNIIDNNYSNLISNLSKTSFIEYFDIIIETYKIYYNNPTDNYFYNQIINFEYGNDLPLYLKNYNEKNNANIYYINHDLINFMNKTQKKFDIIQISNITDWMSEYKIIELLRDIYRRLNTNGIIILRRLSSDINLSDILNKINLYLIIDNNVIDKSFFYKEIIIARKI